MPNLYPQHFSPGYIHIAIIFQPAIWMKIGKMRKQYVNRLWIETTIHLEKNSFLTVEQQVEWSHQNAPDAIQNSILAYYRDCVNYNPKNKSIISRSNWGKVSTWTTFISLVVFFYEPLHSLLISYAFESINGANIQRIVDIGTFFFFSLFFTCSSGRFYSLYRSIQAPIWNEEKLSIGLHIEPK